MKSFKTKLYKVSFDANDIKKIVHIETLPLCEEYESFFDLVLLVKSVLEMKRQWKLSNEEAVKIIGKASQWLLDN